MLRPVSLVLLLAVTNVCLAFTINNSRRLETNEDSEGYLLHRSRRQAEEPQYPIESPQGLEGSVDAQAPTAGSKRCCSPFGGMGGGFFPGGFGGFGGGFPGGFPGAFPVNPMMPGVVNPMMPGMVNPMMPGINPMIPGVNPMIPGLNPMIPGVNPIMPGVNPLVPGLNPMVPGLAPPGFPGVGINAGIAVAPPAAPPGVVFANRLAGQRMPVMMG